MKISGKVHFIGQTKVVSDKFKSRELVLRTDEKYPQTIPFQLSQDKTSLADNLKIGDDVEVGINLRGREWTSPTKEVKYFATLEIWTINLKSVNNDIGNIGNNFLEESFKEYEQDSDLPF